MPCGFPGRGDCAIAAADGGGTHGRRWALGRAHLCQPRLIPRLSQYVCSPPPARNPKRGQARGCETNHEMCEMSRCVPRPKPACRAPGSLSTSTSKLPHHNRPPLVYQAPKPADNPSQRACPSTPSLPRPLHTSPPRLHGPARRAGADPCRGVRLGEQVSARGRGPPFNARCPTSKAPLFGCLSPRCIPSPPHGCRPFEHAHSAGELARAGARGTAAGSSRREADAAHTPAPQTCPGALLPGVPANLQTLLPPLPSCSEPKLPRRSPSASG